MFWLVNEHAGNNRAVIIDLARKATALRPDVVKNWYMFASYLLQAGEVEKAITALTTAISKLPTDPRLYLMLADAYHRTRRVDLVREVLQRAPTIPMGDREMTISRFELLMKAGIADDEAQVATNTLVA